MSDSVTASIGARRHVTRLDLAVLFAAPLLAILMALIGPGIDPNPHALPIEEARYLGMAGWDPGVPLPAPNFPSQYRVLSPTIARLLPGAPPAGFAVLTVACLTAYLLLLKRIGERLGLTERDAFLGCLLALSLFYPTVYYLRTPFMTDPLFFVLWSIGILLVLARRPVWLAVVLTIGVFNKETIVFLTGAAVVLWFSRRAWVTSLATAILPAMPAVALYLGLKSVYASSSSTTSITPAFVANWLAGVVMTPGFFHVLASGILLSGGVLWLYVALGLRSQPEQMRRYVLGGALSVFPLLLLASDSGRQFGKLSPFWIPAIVAIWGRWLPGPAFPLAVACAIVSNVVLAIAAPVSMPVAGEIAAYGLGVVVALLPLAMRMRVRLTEAVS
jgi:hypothetical protein